MTLEEIYSELSAHMIKGLMIHDQMSNYYCFLKATFSLLKVAFIVYIC